MTRHLKRLIFDSPSFTEGLITCLFTTDGEAPDFNRETTPSALLFVAAWWRGVLYLNNKYKTIFKYKQFINK
jgi:hypothetical protein